MTPAATLIKLTRDLDGEVRPPSTADAIARTEQRLGHFLPKDLREFYQYCDGVYFGTMFNFFPLEELEMHRTYRKIPDARITVSHVGEISTAPLMLLCDSMIDAPSYWISIDPKDPNFGTIFCDGLFPWWMAAESFARFVERLVADPENGLIGI